MQQHTRQSPADGQHAFSVAPMMDLTDRYCRYFHRSLSSHALLYSEMLTTGAVIHGDRDHLLGFDEVEGPVVLQLGGSDPAAMAKSAIVGQQYGYAEINMNVGCPSDRVQSGRFGACLMAESQVVADCVAAMRDAVQIPVTVKCRIGIDRNDAYEPFAEFIEKIRQSGCTTFIVHARKAWLDGLSPKENRDLPPLRYDYVQRIKQTHPDLVFILNGGLDSHQQALLYLQAESGTVNGTAIDDTQKPLDGVMLGRAAYKNPWLLRDVDEFYYGKAQSQLTRVDAVEAMLPYCDEKIRAGVPLGRIVRHMLGLFLSQPGGRLWRRHLSETAWKKGAGVDDIKAALDLVNNAAARTA